MTNARHARKVHAREQRAAASVQQAREVATFLREAVVALVAGQGGMVTLDPGVMRGFAAKGWELVVEPLADGKVRLRAVGPPAEDLDVERYVVCPDCGAEIPLGDVTLDEAEHVVRYCPEVHCHTYGAADVHERVVTVEDSPARA